MMLIAIKIILSVLMVLGLIYISEKSPRLGGLCSGLPLSVGVFTYFYARENGLQFLIDSMPYALAGFTSTLIFTMGFYLGGKLFINQRFLNTISALVVGFVVYFISGYGITSLHLNLLSGFIIFLFSMIVSIFFFRHVPDNKRITGKTKLKPTNKIMIISFRVTLVSSLVLLITGVSRSVGHEWAGVFSSFPVMLTSVTTVLIFSYKDQLYPGVLKHFSYGVSILIIYDLLIYWLYPILGINFGTVIAYIICFFYLALLNKLNQ
ncbi:MFS transporter [Francisella frigiditurris]|uniref:Putative membrane protein n=1 Tax=Francisella frigiditurris TaxID=1542390 RepID=A0A1J0KRN9_9GAMM|nr:MFS transporter [Francisella frigiditurris]APC96362.1 putative membrane protein [Francisella frigiditurris]